MKSNASCWTPRAGALLIVTLLFSACAMGGSDTRAPCPPVVGYSVADQSRAAAETVALPEGAVMMQMTSDYAALRDQARSCQ